MTATTKPWLCPVCGGEWIRNYVFRHKVNQCPILTREDATQSADAEKLWIQSSFERPATPAEILLHNTISVESIPEGNVPPTVTVSGNPAIRTRTINGLDPDNL